MKRAGLFSPEDLRLGSFGGAWRPSPLPGLRLLLDAAYCSPRDVALDGRVLSRGRFGSFDLLEVSSEAGALDGGDGEPAKPRTGVSHVRRQNLELWTQARASSRTLKTSCSVAPRTADAGTDTTAIVWPAGRENLELVAVRNVSARWIVLDDDADVACAKAFFGKVPR